MKHKKLAAILVGIFLLLIVGMWVIGAGSNEVVIDENRFYAVTYVIDGDTFVVDVDRKEVTVRMLGINTPESVDPRRPVECFGVEASREAKRLLGGRSVSFKYNPNREKTDKYARQLVYVYRDDGLFVNEFLIRNGFAREYTYGKPYSMQKEFRSVEKVAEKTRVGLWGKCKIYE